MNSSCCAVSNFRDEEIRQNTSCSCCLQLLCWFWLLVHGIRGKGNKKNKCQNVSIPLCLVLEFYLDSYKIYWDDALSESSLTLLWIGLKPQSPNPLLSSYSTQLPALDGSSGFTPSFGEGGGGLWKFWKHACGVPTAACRFFRLLFRSICFNVWIWVLGRKLEFISSKVLSNLKCLRTETVVKGSILMGVLKNSSSLLEFFQFLSADYSKCREDLPQTVHLNVVIGWQQIRATAFLSICGIFPNCAPLSLFWHRRIKDLARQTGVFLSWYPNTCLSITVEGGGVYHPWIKNVFIGASWTGHVSVRGWMLLYTCVLMWYLSCSGIVLFHNVWNLRWLMD